MEFSEKIRERKAELQILQGNEDNSVDDGVIIGPDD